MSLAIICEKNYWPCAVSACLVAVLVELLQHVEPNVSPHPSCLVVVVQRRQNIRAPVLAETARPHGLPNKHRLKTVCASSIAKQPDCQAVLRCLAALAVLAGPHNVP